MSINTNDTRIADTVWPAVERAIRGHLRRPEPVVQMQVDQMVEWFSGAVIWDVARELDRAGFRVPGEC
jgi:hypothetical protein